MRHGYFRRDELGHRTPQLLYVEVSVIIATSEHVGAALWHSFENFQGPVAQVNFELPVIFRGWHDPQAPRRIDVLPFISTTSLVRTAVSIRNSSARTRTLPSSRSFAAKPGASL